MKASVTRPQPLPCFHSPAAAVVLESNDDGQARRLILGTGSHRLDPGHESLQARLANRVTSRPVLGRQPSPMTSAGSGPRSRVSHTRSDTCGCESREPPHMRWKGETRAQSRYVSRYRMRERRTQKEKEKRDGPGKD